MEASDGAGWNLHDVDHSVTRRVVRSRSDENHSRAVRFLRQRKRQANSHPDDFKNLRVERVAIHHQLGQGSSARVKHFHLAQRFLHVVLGASQEGDEKLIFKPRFHVRDLVDKPPQLRQVPVDVRWHFVQLSLHLPLETLR